MSESIELDAAQQAELAALQTRAVITRRANAEPFPGPLAAAYAAPPLEFHGLIFRPIVLGDFIIFRRLDSPMFRHILSLAAFRQQLLCGAVAADSPPPETKLSGDEILLTLSQFAQPARHFSGQLADGPDLLRERAVKLLGRAGDISRLAAALPLIQGQIEAAFSTALDYEAEKGEDEIKVNFAHASGGRSDGFGWWFDCLARIAANFPWPRDYIVWELPLIEAFAFASWSIENNGLIAVRRAEPGYLAQEIRRLGQS